MGGISNSRHRVFVQLVDGKPVQIFGKHPPANTVNMVVLEWPRMEAVRAIREQIWQRTGGHCEFCGKLMTSSTMHMHEVLPRSKGGKISLQNSVGICYACHEGRKDSEHGNRQLRFGEQ